MCQFDRSLSTTREDDYIRTKGEHAKIPAWTSPPARALIAASILAARKLAQFDDGKGVPAIRERNRGRGPLGRGDHEELMTLARE
jgi:hypothetical protein